MICLQYQDWMSIKNLILIRVVKFKIKGLQILKQIANAFFEKTNKQKIFIFFYLMKS